MSRALKALEEKGFIDLELLRVKVKILAGGLHCCDEAIVLPTDNSVVSTQQARSPRNKRDRHATSVIATQQARSLRNNDEPEPIPDKDSTSSKTINTYSDFINTLSEDERESFISFGKKEADSLPKPVTLPLKWIEKNFQDLRSQWEKQRTNSSTHCGAIISTFVHFENWDAVTHEGQYHTMMNLGLAKFCENATSKAWYEWARAKHPSKFIEVPE